jgi:hypothetical protein
VALEDVTDRNAVLDAIDEFDASGREAFIARYGTGRAPHHVVDYTGIRYDSLPLLAAAHGYQHGTALPAAQLEGAEVAARAVLERLGFRIVQLIDPPTPTRAPGTRRTASPPRVAATPVRRVNRLPTPRVVEFVWQPGDLTNRAEIARAHGGPKFGVIAPATKSPDICLFSDTTEGSLSGTAHDGWDSSDADVYHFTGEGARGDQRMLKGNKAILEHARSRRTLRLFEATPERPTADGRQQRYLGAFQLDEQAPWRHEWADDTDGAQRQVLVFRLVRAPQTRPDS